MTVSIEIANRQRALRVDTRAVRRLLDFFLARAARHLPAGLRWGGVTALLVDNAAMRRYKQAVFGRDEVTDVISQAYAALPTEADDLRAGEIVVNAQRARELGPRHGGAARELALYLAHGVDHLTDADDDTPVRRRGMRRRELRWCAAAGRSGLLRHLLRSDVPC